MMNKLHERDLLNIVKRVIKEDIEDNNLYQGINKVLWDSNATKEEQIEVLKRILKEKEGMGFVTKEKINPDLSGLQKLVHRVIRQGIDEEEMDDESNKEPDYIEVYHMYKNGEVSKKDFYAYMGMLEKHERQGLIDYINREKESSEMRNDMTEESDYQDNPQIRLFVPEEMEGAIMELGERPTPGTVMDVFNDMFQGDASLLVDFNENLFLFIDEDGEKLTPEDVYEMINDATDL